METQRGAVRQKSPVAITCGACRAAKEQACGEHVVDAPNQETQTQLAVFFAKLHCVCYPSDPTMFMARVKRAGQIQLDPMLPAGGLSDEELDRRLGVGNDSDDDDNDDPPPPRRKKSKKKKKKSKSKSSHHRHKGQCRRCKARTKAGHKCKLKVSCHQGCRRCWRHSANHVKGRGCI